MDSSSMSYVDESDDFDSPSSTGNRDHASTSKTSDDFVMVTSTGSPSTSALGESSHKESSDPKLLIDQSQQDNHVTPDDLSQATPQDSSPTQPISPSLEEKKRADEPVIASPSSIGDQVDINSKKDIEPTPSSHENETKASGPVTPQTSPLVQRVESPASSRKHANEISTETPPGKKICANATDSPKRPGGMMSLLFKHKEHAENGGSKTDNSADFESSRQVDHKHDQASESKKADEDTKEKPSPWGDIMPNECKFQFHIYVPSEINFTPGCKIGIFSSWSEWDHTQMLIFDNVKKWNDGFLVQGLVMFDLALLKEKTFDYKYLMRSAEEDGKHEYFVEYLGKYDQNRQIKYSNTYERGITYERFDCMMLPPDKESKGRHEKSFWDRMIKKVINKFYEDDMVLKHEDQIISAMLTTWIQLEANDTKISKFYSCSWHIFLMMHHICNFFLLLGKDYRHPELRKKFLIEAPKIVNENNKANPANLLAILFIIAKAKDSVPKGFLNRLIHDFDASFVKYQHDIDLYMDDRGNLQITSSQGLFVFARSNLYNSVNLFRLYVYLSFYKDKQEQWKRDECENDILQLAFDFKFRELDHDSSAIKANFHRLKEVKSNSSSPLFSPDLNMIVKSIYIPDYILTNNAEVAEFPEAFSIRDFLYFLRTLFLQSNYPNYQGAIYMKLHYFFNQKRISDKISEVLTLLCDRFFTNDNCDQEELEAVYKQSSWLIKRAEYFSPLNLSNSFALALLITKLNVYCILKLSKSEEFRIDQSSIEEISRFIRFIYPLKLEDLNGMLAGSTLSKWNLLFEVHSMANIEPLKSNLQEIIETKCHQALNQLRVSELIKLVEKYNSSHRKYVHQGIQDATYEAIHHNWDTIDPKDLAKLAGSTHDQSKLQKVADSIIQKKWPADDTEQNIFKFMFESYNFLKGFLFLEKVRQEGLYQQRVVQVVSLLEATLMRLESGNIRISLLKMLDSNLVTLLEILLFLDEQLSVKLWPESANKSEIKRVLEDLIAFRLKELTHFAAIRDKIKEYLNFLGLLNVGLNQTNADELQSELKKLERLDQLELDSLIKCLSLAEINQLSQINSEDRIRSMLTERISVIEFQKTEENIRFIDTVSAKIASTENNRIFIHFVRENLRKLATLLKTRIQFTDYHEKVVKSAYSDCVDLCRRILDGSLVLEQFDKFIISDRASTRSARFINETNWQLNFRKLLELEETDNGLINERITQLSTYREMTKVNDIAEALIAIRDKNQLQGDFRSLEEIAKSTHENIYKTKQIKEIDGRVKQMYKKLSKMNEDRFISCLHRYVANYSFIEWVRQNTKNIGDVKLLAEFASESDNEGALEVARVQSFLLVCSGYSPLIYDLKANSSYEDLISYVEAVQTTFSKNPTLPEKIDAISKEKSWLEDIKSSKGNAEANSLKQAKRINKSGIYSIGLGFMKPVTNDELSLLHIIKLQVPAVDKEPERSYTFNQLVDLQDKLTLVVGKDEEQQEMIQYFENILEGVISLGEIYLNLIRIGNVLFKNWNATVYCDKNSTMTLKVNLGLADDQSSKIVGLREQESSTALSLNSTVNFLKDCYKEWLAHVNTQRDKFPELNYFRIDQIVLLRTKMAQFIRARVQNVAKCQESDLNELYDLLYVVNNQVNEEVLLNANRSVFQTELKVESVEMKEEVKEEEKSEEVLETLKALKEIGFSERVIAKGIRELNTTDRTELMDYCFENDHLDTESQSNEQKVESPLKELNLLKFDDIKFRIFDEKMLDNDSLKSKYDSIWHKFKEYLDNNFDEFVSLNHLGLVLQILRSQDKMVINRVKPSYLEYNMPNLIVCPQDEIIKRALNIYALSPDQPLPTIDEVLYCTQKTSHEEIELFWKRCMLDYARNNQQRIYCLMNVQDLLYDQAVKAHTLFERYFSSRDQNQYPFEETNKFLLCILCSVEREDKSLFATAFNRYRRNVPLEPDIDQKLNEYLTTHFEIKDEDGLSISKIEKDKLSMRVITSDRAGVGKSLYVKRQLEQAQKLLGTKVRHKCISIKKQTLPFESVFQQLSQSNDKKLPTIVHIDIAYEVWYDVDYFLFNLFCLRALTSSDGRVYRRSPKDLYLVEIMPPRIKLKNQEKRAVDDKYLFKPLHSILTILPYLTCQTPVEVFDLIQSCNEPSPNMCPLMFDKAILESELIQRPCQYLSRLAKNENLDRFSYTHGAHQLSVINCLELLLKHLETKNPSWSEIIHFASFLNTQLKDAECSIFCNETLVGDTLPGFRSFVVKFMVQMSHDFALPSLEISDRSALQLTESNQAQFQLDQLNMRRKWESDPHPYLFFNPDGQTFTFFGLNVDRTTGFLKDPNTNKHLFADSLVLNKHLIQGIELQNPSLLRENISTMSKTDKIRKLLSVMGVEWSMRNNARIVDPDPSYELTMDNLLKIIAIYMRLRANIPVIIMGETGCGKTRLIKYMCELQKNPTETARVNNMYIVKVHGGTSHEEIVQHTRQAQALARQNNARHPGLFTVLFFDEANSTEAIGTIKEIMCDGRLNGEPLDTSDNLKIIAACNPYKKHSEDAIQSFEKSGLGFYVDMSDVQEKLGDLPMRHLVYRVQPLPSSMLPIIWDFGRLNDQVERLYVAQIVNEKLVKSNNLIDPRFVDLIVNLLACSQRFMRTQQNECSFVSLRDIQRVIKVFLWFLQKGALIFNRMQGATMTASFIQQDEEINEVDQIHPTETDPDKIIKSIIMALNTCYHVGLQSEDTRRLYRREIADCFRAFKAVDLIQFDEAMIKEQVNSCYEVFLNEIKLPDAIAKNQALKENIFMILICIELKIPLFIIGKPGSSKSLAKTLIAHKMQGPDRLNSTVLSTFKEAHLITFQCSPLSTSDMILKTFRLCAKYQNEREKDLDRYTSVVVLDEIGLAEASPSMPLKTLHPLLEDGVYFEDEVEQAPKVDDLRDWHRVGFIGISNWVLDPAKMNRGIFVNRNSPSVDELKDIVVGICKNEESVLRLLKEKRLIDSLSAAYLELCDKARTKKREFFGLRDFYSLIKMIYWHIKENYLIFDETSNRLMSSTLDWNFLAKAVQRNFGGLHGLDPVTTFFTQFNKDKLDVNQYFTNEATNSIELIKEALVKRTTEDENRYLLLLSENDNALELINNYILNEFDSNRVKVIFGSSFPNDQAYSQICRKIHQIKLSMELGKIVILLNLENLYESLYDALNQFYYKFGDNEKFVDLGLGTARVKCLVHNDFRLIVVADKKNVYNPKKYPIPLVNRLEKHLLSIDSILTQRMKKLAAEIKKWLEDVTTISDKFAYKAHQQHNKSNNKLKPVDIFVGLTDDTVSSLVFKFAKAINNSGLLSDESYEYDEDSVKAERELVDMVKRYLLQLCTSDGIIRLLNTGYLKNMTGSSIDINQIVDIYYKNQTHDNFVSFFNKYSSAHKYIQVTTHSKLLSKLDLRAITDSEFRIESLLSFDTQQQFVQVLREFYERSVNPRSLKKSVLVVQVDSGHYYQELINCARFTIIDELDKYKGAEEKNNFCVLFIIQIPKIAGGCISSFQSSKWLCYHIDDLQSNIFIDNILSFRDRSLSEIFHECSNSGIEEYNHGFMFMISLLRSVVFNACSKVIDSSDRSIKRIDLLLKLLHPKQTENDLEKKFCQILTSRLAMLQEERESSFSMVKLSKQWMFNEVSKISNVIKYGTLKNSCINYIESKLAPLFSGVISFIDTNHNLDLLMNNPSQAGQPEWVSKLWLHIFNDPSLVNLSYKKSYLNITNHGDQYDERIEFPCFQTIKSKSSHLKFKLPFSWLIKQNLDDLIQLKTKNSHLDEFSIELPDQSSWIEQLISVFVQTPLHDSMSKFIDQNSLSNVNTTMLVQFYLNDFVLANISIINDQHMAIVKKRFNSYCHTTFRGVPLSNLNYMVAIHLAFDLHLKQEISLFNKFVGLNTVGNKILNVLNKSDLTDSDNLCHLAAKILINELKERVDTDSTEAKWKLWHQDIEQSLQIVESYMSIFPRESITQVDELSRIWQRCTLTKLFIQHFCSLNPDTYRRCISIWNFFKEICDFKKKNTFDKLEVFLKPFVKVELKKLSPDEKCKGCTRVDWDLLFESTCHTKCLICEQCLLETKTKEKCAGCEKDLGHSEPIVKSSSDKRRKESERFISVSNCFLMDIITNLTFNKLIDSNLPEKETIDYLIDLLLPSNRTESSSAFNLRLNPSIKSTLFQIILRYEPENVEHHLMSIFSRSKQYLMNNYDSSDLINLKLMYINSIEDNLCSRASENRVQTAIDFLKNDLASLSAVHLGAEEIGEFKLVAEIKFCLSTLAHIAIDFDSSDPSHRELAYYTRELIEQMEEERMQEKCPWTRFYLIKLIFRRHGKSDSIKVASNKLLSWIFPSNLMSNNIPDSFLALGPMYKTVRDSISDSLTTGQDITVQNDSNQMLMLHYLATFKLVTLDSEFSQQHRDRCVKVVERMKKQFKRFENEFEMLMEPDRLLHVNDDMPKNLAMLLTHLYGSIKHLKNKDVSYLNLFKQVFEKLDKQYLPSMPHDGDFEAFVHFKNLNPTIKFYNCPNGHVYSIGECTRPAQTSTCPTCKQTIGGANYQLATGNTEATNLVEKEGKGYCLQDANRNSSRTIRTMGTVNTMILRTLLDSTLYLAASHNRPVHNIMTNGVLNNLAEYFYAHLRADLRELGKYLEISTDDVVLFMHFVVDSSQDQTVKFSSSLKTKQDRDNYENAFCGSLNEKINAHGGSVDKVVQRLNGLLKNDSSETDQLFRIAHDLIQPACDESHFLNDKCLWTYRRQITMDTMIKAYESCRNKLEYSLLTKLVRNLWQYELIKHAYPMLKMIETVHLLFNKQIDKQSAMRLTVSDLIESDKLDLESREVIEEGAKSFLYTIKEASLDLNLNDRAQETLNEIRQLQNYLQLPLATLLPSNSVSMPGVFILSLLIYLQDMNNQLIKFYFEERGNLNEQSRVEWQSLSNVNELVAFSVDTELLRIVFMYSNYSLESRQETSLEFNFYRIQESFAAKFLTQRCIVDYNTLPIIEYSDSISDMNRFELLNQRIKQNDLSYAMKEKIASHYKQPNHLNEIIRTIHIVIDFLKTSNCPPGTKIIDYATNTLKMVYREDASSNKSINELDVTYLESLWNLLTLRRVMLLTEHGQDPFDQLDASYKQNIREPDTESDESNQHTVDQTLIDQICNGKRFVKPNTVFSWLDLLNKFIVYRLTSKQSAQDASRDPKLSLNDVIANDEFVDQIVARYGDQDINPNDFNFSTIQLQHIYHLWRLFNLIYLNNKTQSA